MQSMFYREVEYSTLPYKDYSRPPLNFFRGFRGTFLDLSNQHADHLDTLWCWLMHRQDGHMFAKLLAKIIKLRAHHPDYPIKSIRLDNPREFTSQTFDDYCMSVGIDVKHPVPMFTPKMAWQKLS